MNGLFFLTFMAIWEKRQKEKVLIVLTMMEIIAKKIADGHQTERNTQIKEQTDLLHIKGGQ